MVNYTRDDENLALSRGFDAGNYAAAYDGMNLESSYEKAIEEGKIAGLGDGLVARQFYRAGFIAGFGTHEGMITEADEAWDEYVECVDGPMGDRMREIGIACEPTEEG